MPATATWGHDMPDEIFAGDILLNILTHTYYRVASAPADGHVDIVKLNAHQSFERWPEARVRRQCRVHATARKGR